MPGIDFPRPALFLDIGRRMGWATLTADERINSGSVEIRPTPGKPPGEAWARVRWWLDQMHSLDGIAFLAFEDPRNVPKRSRQAAIVAGGFIATIEGWAYERSIPCRGVYPNQVRAVVCGDGSKKKEDVQEELRRMGHSFGGPDQADALAVLEWARGRGRQLTLGEAP